MAKLTRVFQKIFGGSLTPTGNIAVFGSKAAGTPTYSNDPASIQSLSQFLNGWAAATVNNQSPELQDMNSLFYLLTRQLAYLFQAGVPEWEATTIYFTGSWAASSTGALYRSKTDNNVNNALTDTNNWESLSTVVAGGVINPASVARAWVNFDGTQIPGNGGGSLAFTGYNISAVNKVAGQTSLYEVVLAGSFPSNAYAYNITTGVAAQTNADFPRVALKSSDRIQFFSLANNSQQGQSANCNVVFYSNSALS